MGGGYDLQLVMLIQHNAMISYLQLSLAPILVAEPQGRPRQDATLNFQQVLADFDAAENSVRTDATCSMR